MNDLDRKFLRRCILIALTITGTLGWSFYFATLNDAPIADVEIGVSAARVVEPVARDVTAGPAGVELRQLGFPMVGLATVQVGETMVLLWVPGGGEMQVLGTFRLPAVPGKAVDE